MDKFSPPPQNCEQLLPIEARCIIREGEYCGSTAGFCLGYIQANLVVLPGELAEDFYEFCKKNSAPLPLLYRSKPGEVSSPSLAEASDVRTDVPRYLILSHGRQVDDMRDLLGFSWTNHVSFYIGCSFSFEEALVKNGIDLPYISHHKSVSMFISGIECCNVNDKFTGCRMVTTMRSVKKDLLQKVAAITAGYPSSHGAPIHIGDPGKIGISDLTQPDYGEVSAIDEEFEVPVFWGCGVTGKQALECLKPDLAFAHYPGSMFITDVRASAIELTDKDFPCVVPVSPPRFLFHASLVSKKTIQLLRQLEELILFDPGNCAVASIQEEGDFLKSVVLLSHCQSVGVVFGFPCNSGYECMEETDGPPGALAIAKALQCLGKKVAIISEERNRRIVESSIKLLKINGGQSLVQFKSCREVLDTKGEGFDCLVAIERVGQAKDGGHYSMRGIDLTSLVDPIDEVFALALKGSSVATIGIGDRGNELGLGKVQDRVKEHLGDKIACDVASDYVILAGVSNWGGYALAVGLFLLATCPVHWRYLRHGTDGDHIRDWDIEGFVQTDKSVETLLQHINSLGVRDGISKSLDQSVDGIPLKTHLDVLQKMRTIATSV